MVNKAVEYMKVYADFDTWADKNFYGSNIEEIFHIYEDFVKSNSQYHIVVQIRQQDIDQLTVPCTILYLIYSS
ncbi:MAG: hypothetical protein ACE5SW_11720, partial [Nitrososphaeraceae archaeon]